MNSFTLVGIGDLASASTRRSLHQPCRNIGQLAHIPQSLPALTSRGNEVGQVSSRSVHPGAPGSGGAQAARSRRL
jgi:hypothetical protein